MKLISAGPNTRLVCKYVGEMAGVNFNPDLSMVTAFAVINDVGHFVAGVVISEYRGHDCQISCAAETPIAWQPDVVRGVFQYVFQQLGCARCTSITKKSNRRCREFLNALGFTLEGNLRLGYDGIKDALIYGLLASECRYLEDRENGQIDTAGTDAARSERGGGATSADEPADGDNQRRNEPHQSEYSARLFDF
jgi:hypothetical protein